jgi:hypothetical protein
LQSVGLIPHHRLEGRRGFEKFILPIVGEADIQADAWDMGHQALGCPQSFQSLGPLLSPHINDAQIGICSSGLRIYLKHLAKVALRIVQPALGERMLAMLKKLRGIDGWAVSR